MATNFEKYWARKLEANPRLKPGSSLKLTVEEYRRQIKFAYEAGTEDYMLDEPASTDTQKDKDNLDFLKNMFGFK